MGTKGKGPVYRLKRGDKALMIEAVLHQHLGKSLHNFRILDIGCGNGDISQYFSRFNEQFGVDVDDRRRPENDGFSFFQVSSERLPFEDGLFDIVISHHVIEHVPDQKLHLSEIRRVLKPRGVAYLATPNKSSPIMQGHVGNELVLRYSQMQPLFESEGFVVNEYSVRLLKFPSLFHGEVRHFRFFPALLLRLLRRFFPSHVFVLEVPDGSSASEQNRA